MLLDPIYCEWCMYVVGKLRPGIHEHHVFGRHNDVVIRLCQEHHSHSYHSAGAITRQDIIDKILIPHYWGQEDRSGKYTATNPSRPSGNRR